MSTNPRIYLDHNATTPLRPEARDAIAAALGVLGNPSSIHGDGRRARELVEQARNDCARLLGAPRETLVFTSGGTEGNVLGVAALARAVIAAGGPRVVAAAAVDHPSLRGSVGALVAAGWQLVPLPVGAAGEVAIPDLTGVGLVAATAVNHELGTVADVAALARAARAAGARLHVDA